MTDEHGANHIGIRNALGSDIEGRTATCLFHYKQSVHRHVDKLRAAGTTDENQELFTAIAHNLATAIIHTPTVSKVLCQYDGFHRHQRRLTAES